MPVLVTERSLYLRWIGDNFQIKEISVREWSGKQGERFNIIEFVINESHKIIYLRISFSENAVTIESARNTKPVTI